MTDDRMVKKVFVENTSNGICIYMVYTWYVYVMVYVQGEDQGKDRLMI